MRLRIQTQSPLPILKAWFIPDVQSAPETVYDLKESLCSKVQALKDGQHRAEDLILLLDDFELLDESPFGTAVRDGDLICLKLNAQGRSVKPVVKAAVKSEQEKPRERKRKRSSSVDESVGVPGRHVLKPPAVPSSKKHVVKRPSPDESDSGSESSSSSSSSRSTSSTSSSSSSSTSSSSSSSLSSSSSTSSSPPKPLSSKKQIPTPAHPTSLPKNAAPNTRHVPPGLGKPTTHSRNQRRKKKREFVKSGFSLTPQQPAAPKGSSDANTVPLGQPSKKKQTEADVNSPAQASSSKVPLATSSSLPAAPRRVPHPSTQAGHSLSPMNNTPPTHSATPLSASASRKRVRRDGPGPDVELALNSASGPNAEEEECVAGDADGNASGGTPTPSPVYITKDQVMMGSLRNKNKKKGFKLSMANPIPQKIVFADGESSTVTGGKRDSRKTTADEGMDVDVETPTPMHTPHIDGPSTSTPRTTYTRQPRLIPPSEIQERGELPPNVFVTSIDVEAGMWDAPSTKKRNRKKEKAKAEEEYYDEQNQNEEWYGQDDSVAMEEASVTLSYSNSDPYAAADSTFHGQSSSSAGIFDWDKAERVYDKSTIVTSIDQLSVAGIVGWKALAINPRTFTPEVLLSTARILRIHPPSPTNESEPTSVVVRSIARHAENPAALSFGFGRGYEEDPDAEGEMDEQDVAEEEIVSWSDVLSSAWRILEL